jgi:acyl-CoA synthetase (AMP-forming)/AMP-acid ligase II
LRGPHVALGYWDGPDSITRFKDGWYRSGDMMRQDENGEFRFVVRRKDLIVRAGSKISPAEVEHVLARHPDVSEAAVIGIALGQRVVGFVRLNYCTATFDLDPILSAARPLLADYKLPETLHALDEIPRTPLGKIDRIALAAAFIART